ncbi:unnamed protein product [Durusdinium trenchii]|uniref:Pseudouridine synthase RsuA/RluA-like domain-containing protein n=1 Tax=Durusdinium trenchii TaxID=1381693 RepID=A0ABP0NE49_9DINO
MFKGRPVACFSEPAGKISGCKCMSFGASPTLVACNAHCDACAGARRWPRALMQLHATSWLALQPNLVTFNSALAGCEKGYEWEHGLVLLASMERAHLQAEMISFSSAISACEKRGQWAMAMHLLQRMHMRRLRADAVAMCAAMSACEKAGQWEIALALLEPTLECAQTSLDFGCAFSAVLGAAERGMAWWMALALLNNAVEMRVSASGMYAGTVASALRKAFGDQRAIDFLKSSRSLWQQGPCQASREYPESTQGVHILGEAPGIVVLLKEADVRTEALVNAASSKLKEELFVVSRLDRPTSGLLPLARNVPAMNWLQAQFSARLVQKEYVCLCEGESLGKIGTRGSIEEPLHAWIWPGEVGRTEVAPFGREAITQYQVDGRFGDGRGEGSPLELMLLSVHPKTGRMHQIRAHLASTGRPIVGDVIYGPSQFAVQSDRMFLHCRRLCLLDLEAKPFEIVADLPQGLQELLQHLQPKSEGEAG